ncbi:hypothetical protein P3X46_018278 [Hevea brasiliensis]|uniref:Uncharacterized protein n=1 Tax=Hevea brasiliensis TaxID=3981 RepID=A0ABQ9LSE8_HEVBR|nr:hypothetical protein P3X46_018278 [Hevea brasiliensis]
MYISILLHHSGVVRDGDGTYEHEGGDMFPWEYLDPDLMGYLEYLDPDLMGYLEIEEELKKLGYGEIRKMAYLMPDEDGDIHIYVEAKKGIISEGENNPIVDNANVNLTPKSKLNDEDACSQNIEVVGDNHSVNLGLQNDPSKEDDVNEDSGDSTDEDYEAFLTRLQAIDDEYDDKAFEDYIIDNSEYHIVRKGKKNDEQPLSGVDCILALPNAPFIEIPHKNEDAEDVLWVIICLRSLILMTYHIHQ